MYRPSLNFIPKILHVYPYTPSLSPSCHDTYCWSYLLENLEESLEKKLDGRVAGLMEDVSWEDVGKPYPPPPTALAPRLLCFMPE